METNYISRFKSELDGKEYVIATKHMFEHAIVKVYSESDDIQWEDYSIVVHDTTEGTYQTLPLSINGECDFWIALGNKYVVSFPKVENRQPRTKIYTATADVRTIT